MDPRISAQCDHFRSMQDLHETLLNTVRKAPARMPCSFGGLGLDRSEESRPFGLFFSLLGHLHPATAILIALLTSGSQVFPRIRAAMHFRVPVF
nr:hypothetical protein [Mesorhizobium sp.]